MRAKKTKGVITVFLIIIFIAYYSFMSILLEAVRISASVSFVNMGSNLAAESVLSYYDEMLYKIYNLMAINEDNTDNVKDIFEDYLRKTTMIVGKNTTPEVYNKIYSSVFEVANNNNLFNLYRVDDLSNITINKQYNLSQSYVVKNQILEHMKYRAPYELLNSEEGFASTIDKLLEINDRIELLNDSKETNGVNKKDIDEQLLDVMSEISFELNMLYSDIELLSIFDYEIIINNSIDSLVFEVSSGENQDGENEGDNNEEVDQPGGETAIEGNIADIVEENENIILEMKDDLLNLIDADFTTALDDAEELISDMDKYIVGLEDKENEELDSMIYMYKQNCGKLIEYYEIISEYQYRLNELASCIENTDEMISNINNFVEFGISDNIVENYKLEIDNVLNDVIKNNDLLDIICDKYDKEEIDESSIPSKEDIVVSQTDNVVFGIIDENDLKDSIDKNINIADIVVPSGNDQDVVVAALQEILKSIENTVSDDVEKLFVNEYVMGSFKNSVGTRITDYEANGWPQYMGNGEKDKSSCNNQEVNTITDAEVEYILTGNTDTFKAYEEVCEKIFGIRLGLNVLSIMLDPSKTKEASEMSGNWAPVALFAWAAGESVLDMIDIQNGYKVELLKMEDNWSLGQNDLKDKLYDNDSTGDEDDETSKSSTIKKILNDLKESYYSGLYTEYADGYSDYIGNGEQEFFNIIDEMDREVINAKQDDEMTPLLYLYEEIVNIVNDSFQDAVDNIDVIQAKYKALADIVKVEYDGVESDYTEEEPTNPVNVNRLVRLGYEDYLRVLLMLQDEGVTLNRIQEIVQANMRKINNSDFTMKKAASSINYLVEIEPKLFLIPKSIYNNNMNQKFSIYGNKVY